MISGQEHRVDTQSRPTGLRNSTPAFRTALSTHITCMHASITSRTHRLHPPPGHTHQHTPMSRTSRTAVTCSHSRAARRCSMQRRPAGTHTTRVSTTALPRAEARAGLVGAPTGGRRLVGVRTRTRHVSGHTRRHVPRHEAALPPPEVGVSSACGHARDTYHALTRVFARDSPS